MAKLIQTWVTKDGKTFDSYDKAGEYETKMLICEELVKSLDGTEATISKIADTIISIQDELAEIFGWIYY